jgi:hypothetical protein
MVEIKILSTQNPLDKPARPVRGAMRAYFLVLWARRRTEAQTEEEFYGFLPEDVIEMHYRKKGPSRGLWFRLKDGRAFNAFGEDPKQARSRYAAAKRKRSRPRS